ncbi:uncharacterized protein LOC126670744 isoform X2 [Mercurialis annua]|uniref:uncharacterized protein LOC126670744 isoform X2 n=1 Tax=Mercurialis annua TaxID=3986 RepID=UPI00216035D4|nr:uncharacterized protein LOC126670744 isoform X2 [Mercurialis annua]
MVCCNHNSSFCCSFYLHRKRSKALNLKVKELQISLNSSLQNCAAERQGRIRAQQALREALPAAQSKSEKLEEQISYPMTPIGFVHSCFSTRNGTPRQPLLVPLARACINFNATRVPPASLEGLTEYSHCWIVFVFHLNTNLDKLWKHPSRSKFKAKVKVPKLKGGRMGVFATRSPHRPCPIGLTVAKVEAVKGNTVLLSGVDLVDGTPVLDIKPYLPYCDSIQGAAVPKWIMEDDTLSVASVSFSEGFSSSLVDCWKIMGMKSLYESSDELQCLIEQVLSWDIRSLSQRNQPHEPFNKKANGKATYTCLDSESNHEEYTLNHENNEVLHSDDVTYHLILEGINISYKINNSGNVIVEKAIVTPESTRQ